jgi:hypothetical protein
VAVVVVEAVPLPLPHAARRATTVSATRVRPATPRRVPQGNERSM